MNGWMIRVYRPKHPKFSAPALWPAETELLAAWQARAGGLQWLSELLVTDLAKAISSNGGYPDRYSAMAQAIVPLLLAGPPLTNSVWVVGEGDQLDGPIYSRQSSFKREAIGVCNDEEWLFIEAWDES